MSPCHCGLARSEALLLLRSITTGNVESLSHHFHIWEAELPLWLLVEGIERCNVVGTGALVVGQECC